VLLPRSPLIPDVDTSEGFGLWEGANCSFTLTRSFQASIRSYMTFTVTCRRGLVAKSKALASTKAGDLKETPEKFRIVTRLP
jgi:hypothetical protein